MKKFLLFSRYLPDGPHNTKGLPVILVGTVWLEKKRLIKSPHDEIWLEVTLLTTEAMIFLFDGLTFFIQKNFIFQKSPRGLFW